VVACNVRAAAVDRHPEYINVSKLNLLDRLLGAIIVYRRSHYRLAIFLMDDVLQGGFRTS